MQTFVAYAGAPTPAEEVASAVQRVEARYAPRWSTLPHRHEAHAMGDSSGNSSGNSSGDWLRTGLVLWQGPAASRWPAWASQGRVTVASLYAPVGYERVVAAEPLATAPLRLAEHLHHHPAAIEELCPPFVCGRLDSASGRLTLHTDALGVGRLFEVRTPGGWVWSNRPEAALAFAGLPARADEFGWQHIAVADELFGHVTAYEGVRTVDAATTIDWDSRSGRLAVSAIDTVLSWAAADPRAESGDLVEAAADQLTTIARSVTRLYADRPVVDLTGGRDSRLVAAAFLAAGADLTLHTHDALPGDLVTARELVALLPDPPEHRIEHVASGGIGAPPSWEAMANARAWHAFAEGLRPFSYLHYRAPESLDAARPLAIGGAGGEVAHGFFYTARRAEWEALGRHAMLAAFAESIVSRFAPAPGADPGARTALRAHIEGTLRDIADRGYPDASVLDVFYLRERIRRWGSTGERPGVVSPLFATSFLRACLSLTPTQRSANELHRALTRRLAPQWADVPYFPAERPANEPGRPKPVAPRLIRVGDAVDRDAINSLLSDASAWSAAFDTPLVRRLWADSVGGRTDARSERVLRAAVWRGAFTDHLAALAGETVTRPVVPWAPTAVDRRPIVLEAPVVTQVPAPAAKGGANSVASPRAVAAGTLWPERAGAAPPRVDRSSALRLDLERVTELQAESARIVTRRVARGLASSPVWTHVRHTPTGTLIRRAAASARRRGLRF
ncbi:hypothetical protein BJY21_000488 [Kineosphaera limosa]|uniref:Asparagine synthetase domain-containing protein n=1 Tax=Kineosphaera limosa NBRC 100340 TaxID=1184609 RepID=K6WY64_9MICO|nr:hypothetical protein [Kineosphaera limosa]NYD99303.1 hypothetical protein [Kineosphaera limosa]GAB97047.1 hypothetical protein KILIM_055_00150 [Kineosphaera limosa NBRC 100340]